MLKELNAKIHKARRKLARAALGLETCRQRIRHHRRQEHYFAGKRDAALKNKNKLAAEGWERKRLRAHHYKRRWQKRQAWLAGKHKYLQLLLDKRLRAKHKWLKEHPDPNTPSGEGWVPFDGHQVAAWMIRDALGPARESGVWNGYVISGYRSPQYCEELCYGICGRPSCSGTCAGRTSNHCGPPTYRGVAHEGAVDVTDSDGLRRWCESHGNPLIGGGARLPYDHPHFSRSGV